MKKITKHVANRVTPQSQPILGSNQTPNHAGGYTFKVSPWTQLNRFLSLGATGGTYYVGEKELTIENATNLIACIKEDGRRVVQTIVLTPYFILVPPPVILDCSLCRRPGV